MKILAIGDVHIWDEYKVGYIKNNISSRIYDFLNASEQIKQITIKNKVDFIILVGDIFHKRRHDALTTKCASKFLRNLKDICKAVIVNVGNHDITDDTGKFNYVKPLADMNKHYKCPSHNGDIFIFNKCSFFVVPYHKKDFIKKVKKLLKKYNSKNFKFLIMHQDIKNMKWENVVALKGLEKEEMNFLYKNFNFVINGHHHIREEHLINYEVKGLNTGILMPIDFKDCSIKPHIDLIEINESNNKVLINKIKLENLPIFEEYNITTNNIIPNIHYRCFLKVILKGYKDKINTWLEKYKFRLIINPDKIQSINYNFEYLENKVNEKINLSTPLEKLIENYIIENNGNIEDINYAVKLLEE